ncbi:MAG: HdeD family acid-resistance protein [Paracoccus sp. (in: a-proteobacteria)]
MTSRVLWIIVGIISIVAGIFALFNPLVATLTAEQVAGWAFLFIGILQIFAVFKQDGWGGRIWVILIGALFVFLGINLLGKPLVGIISLTLTVATLFLISGIFRVILSFSLRGTGIFWMVLLSGAISVILAIMIFSNFPQSAAVILGILLAVELISNGIMMIALGGAKDSDLA